MDSIHPLVVHFPIALLWSGVGLDGAALLLRRPHLHRVALWNLALGTLGAAAAVLSGLRAEAVAKHSFDIWKVLELHERLGFTTCILGLLIVGGRLWRRDRLSTGWRMAALFVSVVMISSLSWGAYLGGRLVYEFGVGGRFGVPNP